MIYRFIGERLDEIIKHFPAVLLTGSKQIGKSTLIFNKYYNNGFSYVSLDDQLELMVARSNPKSFLELHKNPLIIDEAQKAPELFPYIEAIINKSRLEKGNRESNGMYILSGSQRSELLKNSKESLSGRACILDMNNLSINEILKKDKKPFCIDILESSKRASRYSIDEHEAFKYIVRGFFPGLYDDTELNTQLFYSSYLATYMQKDLKELTNVNDESKFINFLRLLASNTGEELVYDNYAKQVGVAVNTIKSWTSTLTKTGIIYLVNPYNEESIVKRIVKRPKMYFFDTGLAAYLCGIDSAKTLQNSFLKGRFFETFIFNEIRKSYMNSGISQELYYYRDTDQNEVDLVLVKDGVLSCLEIKTGQSFNTSATKAFKKLDKTKLSKGKNAIICTTDKVSLLDDKTLLLPVSTI